MLVVVILPALQLFGQIRRLQVDGCVELLDVSARCERSTLPFKCGDAGLIGRYLMPYSTNISWKQ